MTLDADTNLHRGDAAPRRDRNTLSVPRSPRDIDHQNLHRGRVSQFREEENPPDEFQSRPILTHSSSLSEEKEVSFPRQASILRQIKEQSPSQVSTLTIRVLRGVIREPIS